jgi:hypothetical protein
LSKADKQEISPPRFLDTAESAPLVRPEQPMLVTSVGLPPVILRSLAPRARDKAI